jgi:SAM-dependent MidA family methyltransferase
MELALYHDVYGYYRSAARRPGRGGDFLTAPEMHPLFGLALSRHILECWRAMGEPSSFVVREYGAGVGGLAYDVLAGLLDAEPALADVLRYEMIEVNAHRRSEAMQAMLRGEDGGFAWREDDLSPEIAAAGIPGYLRENGMELEAFPDGSAIEVSLAAAQWMAELAETLRRGYALIIDYGYPVQELLRDHRLAGTVRGYSRHAVNDDPLQAMGEQDLTAHVDFTWLMQAAMRHGMKVEGLTTQGDFLARIGLGELLVAMQQQEGMTLDVYYRAQAAVYRLIDPGGMGRFRVLGVSRGVDAAPLRGFVETGLSM